MEEKVIRLAALLHDVGKFWQGTGERGEHAELSSRFIREYVPEQWQGATGVELTEEERRGSREGLPLGRGGLQV